ncbi:MAG: SOS response-associated peptidase family protein [Bdellovibrionales bacterium]
MCAIFVIKTSSGAVRVELDTDPNQSDLELNGRFVPYSKAPVVVSRQNKNIIKKMNFSLVPHWSKTPKVKFATHNARLDTILEKPTWREPFVKKHCLVPISEFIESITEVGKKFAGNLVRLHEKENGLMVAAGIYDEWVNKDTGEIIESFAILTAEPPPFIAEIGHDRCPVFISKPFYNDWLNYSGDGKGALALLKQAHRDFDFDVKIDRPLKAGWEKRG